MPSGTRTSSRRPENARAARRRVRLRRRPRPAARGGAARCTARAAPRWVWRCHIDTSAPNPDDVGVPARLPGATTTPRCSRCASSSRPTSRSRACAIDPAGDRPAQPEEPAARRDHRDAGPGLDRGRCRPAARSRRSRASTLEGPARRHRRVPARARGGPRRCSSPSSARWRSTTPRAGTSTGELHAEAAGDPRITLFTNLTGVGNIEVNAFQRLVGRRRAEVDPRGLRARRLRVALEGHPGRRRPRRRDPAADAPTAPAGCSSTRPSECAGGDGRAAPRAGARPTRSAAAAASAYASTSCCRGCCSTSWSY